MESIIVTKYLTKLYKTGKSRIHALSEVSLQIEKGEFVAITGTSGSGKSTLLNMLAGLERPTAGKVLLLGSPIHRMEEQQLVDFRLKHVGFVFQAFHLMPTMTAVENAAFPLACKGVPKHVRDQAAQKLLVQLGLGEHLAHKPSELSGGQQQRVSIARAIIGKPDIVFADEPTGNLDSKTSRTVMEALQDVVKRTGTTLVLVTHDMEKAEYADRIIQISDGKVLEEIHEAV